MLARGYTDADVYEKLVASSLAQEEYVRRAIGFRAPKPTTTRCRPT